MKIPLSYVRSNVAGFVNLLKVCKSMNPQPAILWNSPSLVYGLDTKIYPFREKIEQTNSSKNKKLINPQGNDVVPLDNLAFFFY